jgi:hypothetical protein
MPEYGIRDQYEKVKELQVKIASYQEASNNANKLAKQRQELQDKLNAISSEQNTKLLTLLPDQIDSIRFILEAEQLMGRLGMPLKNVKYTANKNSGDSNAQIGTKDTSHGTFTFEFTTEGTFSEFLGLLNKLEKNLRIIDVKSITFNAAAGVGSAINDNRMIYNVKMNTYWLK